MRVPGGSTYAKAIPAGTGAIHGAQQLETVYKQQQVRLFWLACSQRQLSALERQYIAYYAPVLNQSKVPTQNFTPSSIVLASALEQLRERLLCIGLDSDSDPRFKTLVIAYLGACSESRAATTAVRRVLQSSNKRKDSLLAWIEVVRRKDGAHWKVRCDGVEIRLIPLLNERLMHNPSMYQVFLNERFASTRTISSTERKLMKQKVKEMSFEECLSVARISSVGIELFPLECGAHFCSIAGVEVLCLTEQQLQERLSNFSGLHTRYPAIRVVSADPIPLYY